MDLQWQQREQNRNMMLIQQQQNHQVQQLLKQQQLHTLVLNLPQPEVPTFTGDPIEIAILLEHLRTSLKLKPQAIVPDCTTSCNTQQATYRN